MTWYEITIAVAGAFGGVELLKFGYNMIFNRKNNSRIANTQATNAEIEVEKNKATAAVEAKEAAEDAHAKQCKQFEERISDLHKSLDTVNEQLDYYIKRDMDKEKRFDEQTVIFRKERSERLALEKEKAEMEVMYLKKVAELELELEKKRCDYLTCPYRKPPTAHTPPREGITIDEYFAEREVNIPIE